MPSLAFFSGFHGAFCAQAFAQSSRAGPDSAPAAPKAVPPFTRARRVKCCIIFLLGFLTCYGFQSLPLCSGPVQALRLPFGNPHGGFWLLAAGGYIGEHVEHDE